MSGSWYIYIDVTVAQNTKVNSASHDFRVINVLDPPHPALTSVYTITSLVALCETRPTLPILGDLTRFIKISEVLKRQQGLTLFSHRIQGENAGNLTT